MAAEQAPAVEIPGQLIDLLRTELQPQLSAQPLQQVLSHLHTQAVRHSLPFSGPLRHIAPHRALNGNRQVEQHPVKIIVRKSDAIPFFPLGQQLLQQLQTGLQLREFLKCKVIKGCHGTLTEYALLVTDNVLDDEPPFVLFPAQKMITPGFGFIQLQLVLRQEIPHRLHILGDGPPAVTELVRQLPQGNRPIPVEKDQHNDVPPLSGRELVCVEIAACHQSCCPRQLLPGTAQTQTAALHGLETGQPVLLEKAVNPLKIIPYGAGAHMILFRQHLICKPLPPCAEEFHKQA